MNEMRPDRSSGEMPSEDREPPDSDTPRFGPTDRAPDTLPPPSWEPGVVEVQFQEGTRPEISATGAEGEAPAEIRSAEDVDLNELNRILRQYELQRAESTFQRSPEQASEAQADAQRQGIEVPNLLSFVTLHFPAEANTEHIAEELNQLPEVERAVPVPRAIPPQTPLNEPLVGTTDQVVLDPNTNLENQWYVFRCRGNQAWGRSSGNGVVIADIDWGYRTSHEDLATKLDLTRAHNSYDGGTNVSHGSDISHGTAVMGIAGAADNNRGMAGMAFGAILWPIQANSGPGTQLTGNSWANAIDWVRTADSGGRRKVIILEVQTGSFGNYEMVPSVNAAIRTAIANGVVVCVAAGNGDRDAGIDDQGNAIPETGSILVGATAYHATENRRAWFSNYGPRIVVCAPGDSAHDLTCSSSADNSYRNGFGGTSGATPKVAATAALLLSANPNLTHAQIRTILNQSGSTVVTEAGKPVGTFLNSEAAVLQAQQLAAGWKFNLTVHSVFGDSGTQNVQANLSGFGWRIIVPGAPDGVTNVHVVLSAAAANGRRVNAFIDGAGRIVSAYLV
jgi:subtilisin family serine protease